MTKSIVPFYCGQIYAESNGKTIYGINSSHKSLDSLRVGSVEKLADEISDVKYTSQFWDNYNNQMLNIQRRGPEDEETVKLRDSREFYYESPKDNRPNLRPLNKRELEKLVKILQKKVKRSNFPTF